jgi:hypothetical protein
VASVIGDKFVFPPDLGPPVFVNAGDDVLVEPHGSSSVTNVAQLTALFDAPQIAQLQIQPQRPIEESATANSGNHDNMPVTNIHITDLHAGFILQ